MLGARQLPFVLAGVTLMTLQPLLVKLSQNANGKIEYSSYSSTLLSEMLKAVVSMMLLLGTKNKGPIEPSCGELFQYAIPGLVYTINNNLVFVILMYVDATTFQLLGQLKIVFTGLLFRVVLKRRLNEYQWLAIWQLACGATVSQIPTGDREHEKHTFWGLSLSVVSCILSAFAGIYNEKIMKAKAETSIHWQNFQLYLWGIVFGLIGSLMHQPDIFQGANFFLGYNPWAFAVVANNAIMGLSISAIMKFADNIARVYTHTTAMLCTMVLSVVLFGAHTTIQLVLAICVVAASAVQYNLNLFEVAKGMTACLDQDTEDNDDEDDEDRSEDMVDTEASNTSSLTARKVT